MSEVLAWHFVGDTLRDGRQVPKDGVTLRHDGPLLMCGSGLHFSVDPFDALQYAPGAILCRVRCAVDVQQEKDKGICRERTILRRMDATDMLRYFARQQALSVVHLWEPPQIVLDYLMSGDESLRAAAGATAWAAAWAAAGAAARAAAGAAAGAAAWDAARAAAGATAWAAAWAAAGAAARSGFNALVRESFGDTQ